MAKVSRKCKNPCPLDKLIGTLAKELGVTKDVARYIYDTMGSNFCNSYLHHQCYHAWQSRKKTKEYEEHLY